MKDSTEQLLFDTTAYEETEAIAAIDADLLGDEDPNYISPEITIHHNLEPSDYVDKATAKFTKMFGKLMEAMSCDNPADFSSAIVSMWMAGCQTSAEIQSLSREQKWDECTFRELQNNIIATIENSITVGKTFDNRQLPVIEEVTEPEKTSGLNRYKCKGSRNHYWRYTYKHNGRTKHLHIKGGNERAPLVKRRVETLQAHIDGGWSHEAIAKLIKSWS